MDIKVTKCAGEFDYLEVEGANYDIEFSFTEEGWLDVDITNNNTGGGELLQISKEDLPSLINFLQNELDKTS